MRDRIAPALSEMAIVVRLLPYTPRMSDTPNLLSRMPESGTTDPDQILDRFLEWLTDIGFARVPRLA